VTNLALHSSLKCPNSFAELYTNRLPPWLIDKCATLGFTHPTVTQLKALEVRVVTVGRTEK
jgi:hypothetical protein